MDEKEPIRFCYEGNAYTNTSSLQGKQRESTQMGVELIGDDSAFADAETIALLINSLQSTGLSDFRISVGNAGYFRGICENAGIDEETEFSLREFISGKNFFAAEKLLEESGAGMEVSRNLLGITELIGSQDALERAEEYADNEMSMAAVKRLRDVYEVLGQYGLEKFVSFDLSMLSKYNYYTGIIFKGFTYGVGDVIATGGRYDDLIGRFGKNSPAVGFMIPVDALLEAMRRQKIKVELPEKATVIKYNEEDYKKKLKKAQELRSEGKSVRMMPE
jgi:ATP phosphoribosyltransferase regulatory subunit